MRPRHKAAENIVVHTHTKGERHASMRPRHKAAENANAVPFLSVYSAASMRPRHKAAENPPPCFGLDSQRTHASMRPRHKAAENLTGHYVDEQRVLRFNEAAA